MNVEFAGLSPLLHNRLTELYCDFATHLARMPELIAYSLPAVQWLAERVLTGLPDGRAYAERPFPEWNTPAQSISDIHRIYTAFSYADTSVNPGNQFTLGMQQANDRMRRHGLPTYPRIAEVDALHLELTELEGIA